MKTILKNYKNGTQEFVKKDDIEPWTSRSKLYDLMIDRKSREKLNAMKLDEIHKSNKLFECYPIDKFKKYYREMAKLAGE
jgi:hypothetical protein